MEALPPEDKYVELNDLRFHYLDWGTGGRPPILFLHGFMGHAHIWDHIASLFRSRYHVIALDQRGHGKSQRSEKVAYSLDDHFSDIAAFVESLDLHDLTLVGHSMGGRNALFYAACNPSRVKRLVMVDARPGSNEKGADALMELLARFPLKARSLDEVVQAIRTLYPHVSPKMCRHIASHGYRPGENGTLIPRYDVRMALLSGRFRGVADDLWVFMSNVLCPTLVVRGKESPFLSGEEAGAICARIAGAKWVEIDGASHMPAQENPDAFVKVLVDFLSE